MLHSAFVLIAAVHVAVCAPQLVSLKDGKIGVNFGGYHAEAGLGGLLTGNAAHGGLTASAGTPFGQNAGAGLGGVVDGRAAGTAFAGATAGGNVGASAGLGGVVGGETSDSGLGAEAHAGGVSHSVVGQGGGGFQIKKTYSLPPPPAVEFQGDFYSTNNAAGSASVDVAAEQDVVQKIKPHRKIIHEAAPTNTVVVEKKIEVPEHVEVVAEAYPEVETTHHFETVQQVAPVKKTTVVTTGVAEQPGFQFQKQFGFNFGLGGAAQSQAPQRYIVEETVPVETPPPRVEVEKRIEVPKVETTRHVVVEKKFSVPKVEVETVQQVAPEQTGFQFQKQFGFNFGGGVHSQAPQTYVVEETVPVQTPPPRVFVEKRIEVPKVETVQEVVPVKQKTVYTTAPVQQPAWGFQKGFGFNFGGYGPQTYQVAPPPVYNPPTYYYHKHHRIRPAHKRVYQYQSEVVPVVQKRKQVVVQSAPPPPAGYGGYAGGFQGRVDSNGFFDSIFNIPIQTLKAVNGLLNTKAQAGGSFQLQKSAGVQLG